jgi:hypothetical protein
MKTRAALSLLRARLALGGLMLHCDDPQFPCIEPRRWGGYHASGATRSGWEQMADFFLFVYALLAMFVIFAMQRNKRERRPNSPMVTMVGWGLFSLSSTLALLLGAVALALAMGMHMQLPAGFEAPIF